MSGGRPLEKALRGRFATYRVWGEWFHDEILVDLERMIAEDREWFGAAA